MISFSWQMPPEVLRLMTKLDTEDALVVVTAINAALNKAAEVAGGMEHFHAWEVANAIRRLKSDP